MNIAITITPDPRRIVGALEALRKAWRDVRAPLRLAQDDFIEAERRLFTGATHWPPLASGTVAEKSSEFPGRPLLVRTGALRAALTGGAGFHAETRQDKLEIRIRDPKAFFHQRGTRRMPRRELIDDDQLRRPWIARLEDHLRKAVASVGDAMRRA